MYKTFALMCVATVALAEDQATKDENFFQGME